MDRGMLPADMMYLLERGSVDRTPTEVVLVPARAVFDSGLGR
jgi:hypothetical protein